MTTFYRPELLLVDGKFVAGAGLLVHDDGRIAGIAKDAPSGASVFDLRGKVLLPGFVNTHSHAFQRLIRGKSESRATSGKNFWSWRGTMYHAAERLEPGEMFDVARMAFLEMVFAGTTTVGEFHYVHTGPNGRPYDDPNLLAKQVIAAARSVGLRIVLLRSAYLRSGYELPRDPGQRRFFETAAEFLKNMDALLSETPADATDVRVGVAPHSIRAVPLDELKAIAAWARERRLPLHMHVSEQVAENEACVREYGETPVALLGRQGLLGPDFTAIHATHITADETAMLADAGVTICACPTTERNLGDGVLAADVVFSGGIPVALGSDSQAQIDPLEDARELEYHLRLRDQKRAILDQIGGQALAARLFSCATANGARALRVPAGDFAENSYADFFTVDLRDLSIAGHSAEDLLPLVVFGLDRAAIRDVAVNGKLILRDGRHPLSDEIVSRYAEVHEKVWRNAAGSAR
ncbi:MAG: formimidoylglutamate deiminase [Acidobacteriaceae bacterium]